MQNTDGVRLMNTIENSALGRDYHAFVKRSTSEPYRLIRVHCSLSFLLARGLQYVLPPFYPFMNRWSETAELATRNLDTS
jgi:hypothetical protein